jgi:YggT family protein
MESVISLLDQLMTFLRGTFYVLFAVAVLLAVVAWASRSRRLSAFSPLGRFSRKVVDPLLEPVDRIILRAGGTGTATPWWALLFVFLAGMAAIFLVTVVRDGLISFSRASSRGAGGLVQLAIAWTFAALQLALLIRVLTSWLGGTFTWFGRAAHGMTEWFLTPLRNVLPPMGGFDISPLVAWFLLSLIQGIVMRAL